MFPGSGPCSRVGGAHREQMRREMRAWRPRCRIAVPAYREYEAGLKLSKGYQDIDQFEKDQPSLYMAIRTYLDANELICIGINHKAFDQRVCYGFCYNILNKARSDGAEIINHARKPVDDGHTYVHILNVHPGWQRPGNEKWRR
jgi:hypothetical protein